MKAFCVFTIIECTFHALFGCPSKDWVFCADDNNSNKCVIPSTINTTTIAFGTDQYHIWTFLEIENNASPKADFFIECIGGNFGEVHEGATYSCCYNPNGNTIGISDEFYNEDNWVLAGNSKDTQFDVPYENGYARWVRYGNDGQYTFRLFSYQVECSSTLFGAHNGNSNFMCWYSKLLYDSSQKYIVCGNSQGNQCNIQVGIQRFYTINQIWCI